MSRNSITIKALAALLAVFAVPAWAQNIAVSSANNVRPNEQFTLTVNATGGAASLAGVNLRISGQGTNIHGASGIQVADGLVLNGHSVQSNTLSSNNDLRVVVVNTATTSNFTGDGSIAAITARAGQLLPNGATIPFTVDTGVSASSDNLGAVVGSTFTSGVVTIVTPFPLVETFDDGGGDGWTFFNAGGAPPLFFGNISSATPASALEFNTLEFRSFGQWQGPASIVESYQGNLISFEYDLTSNKSLASEIGMTRMRAADGLFHIVPELVVDPGTASPSPSEKSYTMMVQVGNDPNQPLNIQPVWDGANFVSDGQDPPGSGIPADLVLQMQDFRARRWSKAAIDAAATLAETLDLSNSGDYFQVPGTIVPWYPVDLNRPNDFLQSPTLFTDMGGNPVWGFTKGANQLTETEQIAWHQKTGVTTVAANTLYRADFRVNTDFADPVKGAGFRVRLNTTGQTGGVFLNQAAITGINSNISVPGQGDVGILDMYPRAGSPVIVSVYFWPNAEVVGANILFAFDWNDLGNVGGNANDQAGSLWVDQIQLYSIPTGSITPIE
jgi:hypothetical protein